MVLVKVVVEAILVFWISLSWIPRGVLEAIRRLCYRFIWSSYKDRKGIPLVSWRELAVPKAHGGWGLNNIVLFSKALGTKSVWWLIQSNGFGHRWSERYIAPETVDGWIRYPVKSLNNVSIIWKAVILAFPLVGNWLVWCVGRGTKVQVGLDP